MSIRKLFAVGCAFWAFAGVPLFAQEAEEVYEKNVAEGSVVDLTAEEVAAAVGKTFVKTGLGTLNVGDVMADFVGDIRVREGYYVLQTSGALGTSAGKTYVEDGATLVNRRGGGQTDGTDPAFRLEEIHLVGNGCEGNGALRNMVSNVDFARNVVLDGDTLIVTEHRLDFRSASFNMNSHKLTVEGRGSSAGFYLVIVTLSNMGDIELTKGYLEFQSQVYNTLASRTVTVRENAQLGLWGLNSWLACKFVIEPNVTLRSTSGAFKYSGTDNRNVLSNVSTLETHGPMKNDLDKNTQWQIRAFMTGDGGIRGGRGGYVQLFCPTNNFTGGLDISGVVENGDPVGGLVVYANGAVPGDPEYPPLKIKNASFQMRSAVHYDLPDFIAEGRVVVSNSSEVMTSDAHSLLKTGNGELTVFGPFNVKGDTSFDAGSVRLATAIPPATGLMMKYMNQDQYGNDIYAPQGVDVNGVSCAYQAWPSGIRMGYEYEGFIRVPGEEGEDVVCNFMTSMARGCIVTIGNVTCANFNDNINVMDNINVSYKRLAMYSPVTLKAGWQPIKVKCWNWYDETRGALPNTGLGWVANFGIGVDWQARCVTNSANYAKLLDPGDGSFLRPSLDENARENCLNPANYRATFEGNVAFGPGVEFDIGDVQPYVPVRMPSLTGIPMVKNGAVAVESGEWTLRVGDVLDENGNARNMPMILTNASLAFPSGEVTVRMDADDVATLAKITRTTECPIIDDIGAFGENTFVLSDAVKATGFRLRKQNGKLLLAKINGMTFIVR